MESTNKLAESQTVQIRGETNIAADAFRILVKKLRFPIFACLLFQPIIHSSFAVKAVWKYLETLLPMIPYALPS
jgi:hypothetical protein